MSANTVAFGLTVGSSVNLLGRRLTMLADRGWQVHLIVGETRTLPQHLDARVQVHVIPMARAISPLADLRALWRWRRTLRRIRPQVVVVATPKAGLVGGVAARWAGVPRRVLEVWGARWDGMAGQRARLLRAADRLAFASATEVVCVSPSLAALVVEQGVAHTSPVVLDHWGSQGVDLARFAPSEVLGGDHSQVEPRRPTMGFLGRLAADKGVAVLISLVARVRAELPDAVIRIAGALDPADPLPPEVLAWLTQDPAVVSWGETDDVASFLRSIDVLVFPSGREGLPNAVIEAAAAQVPTVAWRVTGSCDAVVNGVTGYLVQFGDVDMFSHRVVEVLQNENLRRSLGRQARTLATERFSSVDVQRDLTAYLIGGDPAAS